MVTMVKKSKKAKQELDVPVSEAAAVIETTEHVTETPKKTKKHKKENKLNSDQNSPPQPEDPEVQPEEVKLAEEETSHTPKSKKKKKEKQQQEDKPVVSSVTVDTDMAELPKAKKKKKKDRCSESEAKVKPLVAEPAAESKNEDKLLFRSTEDSDLIRLPVDTKPPRAGAAKQRMKADLGYITSFLSGLHIPQHKVPGEAELEDAECEDGETREERERRIRPGATSRAESRQELQQRLQEKLEHLKGSKRDGPSWRQERKLKRKLAGVEKKRRENEELKQKLMTVGQDVSNGKRFAADLANKGVTGGPVKKPGVRTEKGVVFSKFDFKNDGMAGTEEKKKPLDPQAALNKIKKNKEKVKLWEEKGKPAKAQNIENNIAWDNALGKAQGEKIKDDVTLLKKSIKKHKQVKNSSKKKWEARQEGVKNKETAFVEKREGNMAKRKKEKKEKKMKTLVARGRTLPGF